MKQNCDPSHKKVKNKNILLFFSMRKKITSQKNPV